MHQDQEAQSENETEMPQSNSPQLQITAMVIFFNIAPKNPWPSCYLSKIQVHVKGLATPNNF